MSFWHRHRLGLMAVSCAQVIKLISQVIADFADGEIDQSDSLFDTETTLQVCNTLVTFCRALL